MYDNYNTKQVCMTITESIIVIHTCLLLRNMPNPYGTLDFEEHRTTKTNDNNETARTKLHGVFFCNK